VATVTRACSIGAGIAAALFLVRGATGSTTHPSPYVVVPLSRANGAALALSDHGQAVGALGDRAFSWTRARGLVDLGRGVATAVNDHGQVVGMIQVAGSLHAFSWTSAGGFVDLGAGRANAVNDRGQVVGTTADDHAFSWTPAGGTIDLGWGFANAVNERGQVVGGFPTGGAEHAFSWTEAGGRVDLGTLQGRDSSEATAVSPDGKVVGDSWSSGQIYPGPPAAFAWGKTSGIVDLGPGIATAVNARGQIGGNTTSPEGHGVYVPDHAVVWAPSGRMLDLGPGYVAGMNAAGRVVGGGNGHAFTWTSKGGLIDLGKGSAAAVNGHGQIAGAREGSGGYGPALWELACIVPNVKGKPLAAARHAITKHRCRVGTIRRARSAAVRQGRVISESPHPGTKLRPRSRVDLVVSRGRR